MRVYLAGPISGHTRQQAFAWRNHLQGRLWVKGVESFVPEEAEFEEAGERDGGHQLLTVVDQAVGKKAARRDYVELSRCDTVLVNFSYATKVSIGTLLELGWAVSMAKRIIVVLPPMNVHDHSFVHWCADKVVPTLEEAANILYQWA